MNIEKVCVFCGSSQGSKKIYKDVAISLGEKIVENGWELIYGGGNIGLMGVIADTVLSRGGKVTGVIPNFLDEHEVGHKNLSKLHIVESMHERKALMADLSDAFIAMPGGFGTFEELCEMITWTQLGIHSKPCGILNIEGFYDSFLGLVDTAIRESFISQRNRSIIVENKDPANLIQSLLGWTPDPTHPIRGKIELSNGSKI